MEDITTNLTNMNYLIYGFIIVGILNPICALYFFMGESERKCFLEDVPEDTHVIVNYKVDTFNTQINRYHLSSDFGIHVDVIGPDHEVMLSRLYSLDGRISFISRLGGEHYICLQSNSTAWFSTLQLRVELSISYGQQAIDYQVIAVKEKYTEVELRIRQLVDQIEDIVKEQNYQRQREIHFRNVSDGTNSLILWWPIIQTFIVLLMGLWQMKHLTSFFKAKKLV